MENDEFKRVYEDIESNFDDFFNRKRNPFEINFNNPLFEEIEYYKFIERIN